MANTMLMYFSAKGESNTTIIKLRQHLVCEDQFVKVSDVSNKHDSGAQRLADVNVTLMNKLSEITWNRSCRRQRDICVNLLRMSTSLFMKDGKELS